MSQFSSTASNSNFPTCPHPHTQTKHTGPVLSWDHDRVVAWAMEELGVVYRTYDDFFNQLDGQLPFLPIDNLLSFR